MSLFDFFFRNSSSKDDPNIAFDDLLNTDQLLDAVNFSETMPFLIFKHSTRCSISSVVLRRFKKKHINIDTVKIFQLDLIKHRALSDEIAEIFEVEHQSPQVILVKNKKVIFHASHYKINEMNIEELLASNTY